MSSGAVELTNFPDFNGDPPKAKVLQLPSSYKLRKTGSVCAMEWTSDGYALGVGWEYGWAVWSVSGRCLASGFGIEDEVDHDR